MKKKNTFAGFLLTFSAFATLLFVLGISMHPLKTYGVWTDLAIGKYILKNLAIPAHDIFSSANSTHTYLDENWLYQVILFILFSLTRMSGLIVLKALLLTATAGTALLLSHKRRWNMAVAAIIITVTFYILREKWIIRSQLVAVFLMYWLMYNLIMFHMRKRQKYLLGLPIIMFLWANVHPSFIIGMMILVIFTFMELMKKFVRHSFGFWFGPTLKWRNQLQLVGAVIISLMVVLLNPYGTELLAHSTVNPGIALFISLNEFYTREGVFFRNIFILIIPALTLLSMIFVSKRKVDVTHAALIGAVFVLCYVFKRFAMFPFLFVVPFAIKYLSHMLNLIINEMRADTKDFRAAGQNITAMAGIAVIITFGYLYIDDPRNPQAFTPSANHQFFPQGVVDYIKRTPVDKNLYMPIEYAGFMLYHLFPDYTIFVDNRTPYINPGAIYDSLRFTEGSFGWEWLPKKYDIQTLIIKADIGQRNLITPRNILHEKISQSPDWRLAYWDDTTLLYRKCYHNLTEEDRNNLYVLSDPEDLSIFFESDPIIMRTLKTELNRRINQDPSSAWCHIFLGILAVKENDLDAAKNYFDNAASILPDTPKVTLFAALIDWLDQNQDTSVDAFLPEFRLKREAYLQAAYSLMLMGKTKKAYQILDTFTANNPDNIEALVMLGKCQNTLGDYFGALASFQKALLLNPHNIFVLAEMSKCYMDHQVWDQAVDRLRDALEITEDNYYIWFLLGKTYFHQGVYNFALSMFNKTTKLRIHHFETWLLIGEIYRMIGDENNAFEALKRALVIQPFSEKTYISLAETFMDVNRYDQADKIITAIEEKDLDNYFQTNPDFLLAKARMSAHNSDVQHTMELLKKVIEYGGPDYKEEIEQRKEFNSYSEDELFDAILK